MDCHWRALFPAYNNTLWMTRSRVGSRRNQIRSSGKHHRLPTALAEPILVQVGVRKRYHKTLSPKLSSWTDLKYPFSYSAFTIDEFFRKTETKPVLYYLPLTEDQIKQRKERQRHATQRQNTTNSNRGTRS